MTAVQPSRTDDRRSAWRPALARLGSAVDAFDRALLSGSLSAIEEGNALRRLTSACERLYPTARGRDVLGAMARLMRLSERPLPRAAVPYLVVVAKVMEGVPRAALEVAVSELSIFPPVSTIRNALERAQERVDALVQRVREASRVHECRGLSVEVESPHNSVGAAAPINPQ